MSGNGVNSSSFLRSQEQLFTHKRIVNSYFTKQNALITLPLINKNTIDDAIKIINISRQNEASITDHENNSYDPQSPT